MTHFWTFNIGWNFKLLQVGTKTFHTGGPKWLPQSFDSARAPDPGADMVNGIRTTCDDKISNYNQILKNADCFPKFNKNVPLFPSIRTSFA